MVDRDNADSSGSLGLSDTQEFLPAVNVGFQKVPKLSIPQARVDEDQH